MAKKKSTEKPSAQKTATGTDNAKTVETSPETEAHEADIGDDTTETADEAAPALQEPILQDDGVETLELAEPGATDTEATDKDATETQGDDTLLDADTVPDEHASELADTLDEVIAEPEPEPEKAQHAAPQPVPQEQRGGFFPLIIGGVIAAALGFIAARALESNDDSAQALDAALQRISTLEQTVENLPEPVAPDNPEPVDLTPIETAVAEQATRLDALTDRVDDLATQPAADGTLPAAAFDSALSELRATAQAQQDEIDALIAEAAAARAANETAAKATVARAAVAQIITALDSGAAFGEPLATVQDTDLVEVPSILADAAPDGVALLSELQARIPDAARDALNAARAASDDGGLGAFFERQLGGRSVVPREGSDADAVLSRIEAATKAGDLETALTEADALPDAAQAAMDTWLTQARQRHEAVTATNALAQRLSAL
ncbi:MAG: hypothetical protein AAGK77_08070 [Pseudomonadota bacterium]